METEDRIKDVIEKHCSCIICHGVLRLPKLLPCFHSFCTDCLEKYISEKISENGQRSFPCPKCSKPIIVPSDVDNQTCLDSFKTDTFTCKLIEVIQAFSSEKSCDICSRRDVTEAATNWCMQCRDAICGDCLKVHICGKTTSDHRVISLEDLHNLSLENVLKDNVLEKCVKHEEYVKMYCMNCKEPVCVESTDSQRRCEKELEGSRCPVKLQSKEMTSKQIHWLKGKVYRDKNYRVSDAVKTLDADVAEVFLRLRSLKEEGNDFVPSLQTHEDIFEASLRKAETDIRSLAEELRRKIDMSEKDLLEELHSAGRHLREKLSESKYSNGTVDLCDMTILTSAQERLDTLLKYGSSSEILDVYNKLKELLMKAEGKNSSTHEDQLKWKVNFEIDKKVKAFNQDFDQLGEIKVDDGSVDEGLSLWGVTVTSRDDIVVLDSRSHVLQKFSSAGERIDQLALSEEPRDITSFGEDEVAVSVVGKQILILSTLTKFIMKRKIDTPKQYDGLEYSSSLRLFLASSLENSCLDVVSRLGEVIRTVSVNNSTGDPLFQTPRYVTFTKEGTYIVSDITGNCVVCLSQDGTQLYSYPSDHDHDLRKPQGVCSDKLGNVFVAEYANSRVHLLTSNGQFQRFVIDKETGLQRPVAIAMTQSSKLVVVQSDGMVKVFSYESEPHSPKSPVTSSHGANEEKDQTILHHYGSLGIRRLSSYGGQGSGTSYAKMFNHPGAIHTAGAGFHSYRRHSESFSPKSPSAQQSPFPNLPNSLKPRHTNN